MLRLLVVITLFCSLNSHSNTIENQIEAIQQFTGTEKEIQLLTLLDVQTLSPREKYLVLNELTLFYYGESDFTSALSFAEKSLAIAQASQLSLETGQALKFMGIMHYFKADIDLAIDYYKQSLLYYDGKTHPILRANVLNNIALAYIKSSEIFDALDYFKEAKPLYQEYGSRMDKIDIKYNIAVLYVRLNHAANAINALNEVIEERKDINDISGLYLAYADLAVAYMLNEQLDKSLALTHKVVTYYQEQNDYYNLSTVQSNLADLYMNLGQPLKAQEYAITGIKFAAKSQHNKAKVSFYHALARAQTALGKIDDAIATVTKSNKFIQSLNNTKLKTENDGIHSLLLMAKNQPEEAINMYQKYIMRIRKNQSDVFNNQLAKYEASQLKQQLASMKHENELTLIKRESERRFLGLFFIITAFVGAIIFLLYRKVIDRQTKEYLKEQVKKSTLELEAANKKLLNFSYVDGLTSLKNRRCFDEDISKLWHKKESKKFHILVADIDSFKEYNDTYGHIAGDKALSKVAEILKNNIRDQDEVYRYGGEEFAIIFSNCNAEIAMNASKRIIEKVEQANIEHLASAFGVITISAGISTFNFSSTMSVDDFINQADIHLYKAKESGKNQLCCA
ncbi:tetratricopeptide repeat-containing diguanylate cyclase [Thalassotalea piscium]|uniref:diguanylate cyclase n=1 Tax=Thalassotalea piscium TaxID=1230533 RepID=A0A7X0NJ35_9GAMM|nr:tetratricopeptide repeat-containing diguanylate cyclase [Thalassotalea piscium]MBB6544331.1 diguanylate cyclase (GGDEF)-like protein [Thalassotalea piscium]